MLRHPSLFVMISALILSHLVFTLHYKELSFSHSLSDLTLTNFASLSSSVVRSLPSSPPSIASLIHLSPSMLIALNTSPDFHLISLTSLSLILTLSLRILHLTNLLPDSPKPQVLSPGCRHPPLPLSPLPVVSASSCLLHNPQAFSHPHLQEHGENPTVDQVRKRAKWDNDDYVCRGLILNEAKYMLEDVPSKKFLVSNFTNYKMTDSRPVLEQYNELLGILRRFTQHKMNMDESIQVSCIIEKLSPSWKDFKHTLKHLKEELTLIELGSHLRIEESPRAQDNDKPKSNNVASPSVVNMVEHNNSFRYNDNKGKRKHHDTRAKPNKKPKVTCWKCGKPGHLKKDYKSGNVGNRANGSSTKGSEDGSSNPLKDRCWFKTYESLNDGSILHMGNKSTALVHGRGCVDLRLNIVSDNIGSPFMSTSKLNDSILWHARLGHVHFKRMQYMFKDGLIPAFDMDTEKCQTYMLN
ncbi:zinc finger, CCHC-type containing protein [Tanacetum coccineum]